MGSHYGAFPVHQGLWQSAAATAHSLPARLAVEHCVHEARGLDVLPGTIRKLRTAGDEASAEVLEKTIYPEEVMPCSHSSPLSCALHLALSLARTHAPCHHLSRCHSHSRTRMHALWDYDWDDNWAPAPLALPRVVSAVPTAYWAAWLNLRPNERQHSSSHIM
jgi:hypothetical protein